MNPKKLAQEKLAQLAKTSLPVDLILVLLLEPITPSDLENLKKVIKEKNIKQVILPYLNVGYENDFIQTIKKELNITYSVRDYDKYCWQFATKGFFKFKEQIPKVLAKFLT